MKLQGLIIILFFVVLCNAQGYSDDDFDLNKQPQCKSAFKCPYEFDTQWTTDGKRCYVFRNPCHLESSNCKRRCQNENELQIISRKRCQSLCNHKCPKVRKPVCGYYNSEYRQFSSECSMEYYMCKTGKTYTYYYQGPCDDPLYLAN